MKENIKNILKKLPSTPWVYQFFNLDWKIIYIGKSVNLKSRVNSYFNGKSKLNFAKQKMIEQIEDIKYIVVANEVESLILETNLIKEYSPKYNILMKDWKNHLYIKITNEYIPRIIKTREKNKYGTYFWPYLSSFYVNKVLDLLQKIFWYRRCNLSFSLQNNKLVVSNIGTTKIPCMYYYIKRCVWPCLKDEINIVNYIKNIENIKDFLNWNTNETKISLEKKMLEKAKELKFEEAKNIKDTLEAINSLEQTQIVREWVVWDYNVINYINKYDKFFVALIEIKNWKITWFYNYELKNKLEETDKELLKAFIENNFISKEDKKISYIIPFEIDFEWIEIKTEVPKIWVKKELLMMAYKNIYEYAYKSHLDSLSTKWFTKKTMLNLLEILNYKKINKSIVFECNDISHFAWTHTVASRSVIEDWKTNPKKYKKFNIKTLEEQKINDFESMREIMERRLKEIINTKYIPDLIIIDWWKWQLSSVLEVIENFKKTLTIQEDIKLINDLQIVSIAKREEELFIKDKSSKFIKYEIPKDKEELRLIQKIRDEAHRFAISFNKQKRLKSQKINILEKLPWFWEKTRKKLLKKYWSVEKLKDVSKEELKEILNKAQIQTLEDHLLI